jgi:hypothetical protein
LDSDFVGSGFGRAWAIAYPVAQLNMATLN